MNTLGSARKNVHTASHRILSQEMVYTRDPENINAILSAPLSDYGWGVARGANFDPLVGKGVFTAEGQT